jgi:hypothetical protein
MSSGGSCASSTPPSRPAGSHRRGYELVGAYRGQSGGGRDLDYQVSRTRAADAFLAILRDGLDPTAVMSGGELRTSFEEAEG